MHVQNKQHSTTKMIPDVDDAMIICHNENHTLSSLIIYECFSQ